ncbi:MAG: glutamate 5-kinase [Candidatus Omnitrophica bacterium]|nr:glutamate 5-kinase [Candidatus Omnitrophota bacterium]
MKKRIVIKIGTKVITDNNGSIDTKVVGSIVSQVSEMVQKGMDVLIVSSGAIGAGMGLLGMTKRSKNIAWLQSMASIGQVQLMDIYNRFFKKYNYHTGQILLTQEDFDNRQRYLNIKYTINTLLEHRVIPIINENDTISTEEIKCGDNDRLSALVADLIGADMLIILTAVDGLLDECGRLVENVNVINKKTRSLIKTEKTDCGTGGMITKIDAADFATKAGIKCYFANGKKDGKILKIINKQKGDYTFFEAQQKNVKAKKDGSVLVQRLKVRSF